MQPRQKENNSLHADVPKFQSTFNAVGTFYRSLALCSMYLHTGSDYWFAELHRTEYCSRYRNGRLTTSLRNRETTSE